MTKSKTLPKKLLAISLGTLMLGGLAITGLSGAELFKAGAEDLLLMTVEEHDELSTTGYKIEEKGGTLEVEGVQHAYDYVFTYIAGSYVVIRNSIAYFNNTTPMVFNVTSSTGVNVTACEGISSTRWTITSTNDNVGTIDAQKRAVPALYLDIGSEKGQAVSTATVNTDDEETGAHVEGTLRILFNAIEIEDVNFLFTNVAKYPEHNGGIFLNFNANEVVGVSAADSEWSHAERYDFINSMPDFFKNIYFLEDYDLTTATAAPTVAELEGKDLYTLMTGDNLASEKLMFQTEVRYDHIELIKKTRQYDNDVDGTEIAFEAGDAFYFAEGLKMIGKDGNGTWTYATEGGSANLLTRNQFFAFDGEDWSADQYALSVTLDTRSEMIEVEEDLELQASVVAGKFVSADNLGVTWTSDDDTVATVDSNGKVTGVAKGSALITATASDGASASCTVTVVEADQIESITLDKRTVTLYTSGDQSTYTLIATVKGGSKADLTVTWSSSNTDIATVDNQGKVSAVAQGQAVITATASDGQTATVTVTVMQSAITDPGDDDNTDSDNKKKSGCGSAIYGAAAALGVAVIAAGVVLAIRKKKKD